MVIQLGHDRKSKEPINIDLDNIISGHFIVFGGSGVGKSYTLRSLAQAFSKARKEVVIFDVHGDLLPNHPDVSSVRISQESNVGLQPFKINLDPEFGGVINAIKSFVYSIDSAKKLGTRQESVLRKLLEDLFAKNGFYADNPQSWRLDWDNWPGRPHKKRYPTFEDLIRFAKSKQREIFLGKNAQSLSKMNTFIKKSHAVKKKKMHGEIVDESELERLKDEAVNAYIEFLDSNTEEKTVEDVLRYTSLEVIASVIERLESIYYSGVFKSGEIIFDPSKRIHRYDLSTLPTADQKLFVNLVLKDEFIKAKEFGFGGKLRRFILLDESKEFLKEDDDNMLIRMILEVRKYGVGMLLGAQNITHFPDDVITNVGTKLVLGVDSNYLTAFSKKLQVSVDVLKRIIPQKSFLMEIKEKGKQSKTIEVVI
ncbi:MAG: ATP-binding protein [Epsilonproteobacteria bacterium]|nr:ATP-binding protein [Campylobacterota bacterium]